MIDSSVFVSSNVIGYYPRSEKIIVTNSSIYSSTFESQPYNTGFDFTNCYITGSKFPMGCCNANYSFTDSQVEDSWLLDGSGTPVSGPVSITNCIFRNTSINNPFAKFIINKSKFIVSKRIYNTSNQDITWLLNVGNISFTYSELLNSSSLSYSGINISGYNGYNISETNTLTNSLFNGFVDALYISNLSSISITQNNFTDISRYHINNRSLKNVPTQNNYHQLKSGQSYADIFYDSNDDLTFGTISYTPTENSILATPPLQRPSNIIRQRLNTGGAIVSWNRNKESRVKNYKVYWGSGGNAFSYQNFSMVDGSDSSFVIPASPANDSIAVTAVDASATGNNDQVNGTESWFSSGTYNTTIITATPPVISAVLPLTGSAGSTDTIYGSNFNSSVNNLAVYYGGAKATIQQASSSRLIVTVPLGVTHDFVTVTNKLTRLTGYSAKKYLPSFSGKSTFSVQDFAPQINFPTSGETRDIIATDLDGDGKPDAVVTQQFAGVISVFRNTSVKDTIGFAPRKDFTCGNGPFSIAFGDLDGDGKQDIVVSNINENASLSVSIFRNTSTPGTISFATKNQLSAASNLFSNAAGIMISDLNKDGKPDLLLNTSKGISIFTNTNFTADSISFNNGVNYTVTTQFGDYLAIADMNDDGLPDIIVPNYLQSSISVIKNTSTTSAISLGAKTDFTTFSQPSSLAVGDLNNDGKPDLLVASYTGGKISVLKNTGTAGASFSFDTKIDLPAGTTPASIVLGDMNGDGKLDIVVPNMSQYFVSVLKNTTNITGIAFSDAITVSGVPTPYSNIISDIDGDGKPDLMTAINTGISVLRNITAPVNTSPTITSFAPTSAATGAVITVTGTNLSGIISATLGGTAVASFQSISTTTAIVVVGNGASGTLSITTASGTAGLSGFTYVPPPNITSFSPTSATTGAAITVTGTNLSGIMSATLGGTAVASFKVLSATTAIIVVGTGTSGSLSITTAGGTTGLSGFTYVPPPTVTSFFPASAAAGAVITVTGTNLSGTLSATLGGTAVASFKVLSSTAVILVVGNGTSGALSITTSTGVAGKAGFVFVIPPQITADSSFCKGETVIMQSSGTYNKQWYRNNVLIPGATASSYTATTTGTYSVVMVYDSVAYPSTNRIDLKLYPQPSARFTITGDTTQCLSGNSFRFTNTSIISGDSASISSRKWYFGDSLYSDLSDPTHIFKSAGTYTVKLTISSNKGCKDSVERTIRVKPTPLVKITQPAAVCNTGSTAIDITASAIYTGSQSGLNYSFWKDSLGTLALINSAAITASGTYYAKGLDTNSCYSIQPVMVTLNALPIVPTITGDASVCIVSSIVLKNTTAGGVWNSSDTQVLSIDTVGNATGLKAGTSTVTYTYTNNITGCKNSTTKIITVNPLPIVGKPLLAGYFSDTLTCFFTSLNIASKNTYEKYLWSTGETTSSININNNTVVSLKIGSNQNTCYSESSVLVTARKNLTPQPTISRQLDSLVSTSSLTYRWLFNNKLTGDTTYRIPVGQRGVYNVSTSIDRFCWNTSADYIVVLDPATIKKAFDVIVYPNPTNGPFNLQVKFDKTTSAVIKITIADQSGVVKWNGHKLIFLDKSIKIPVSLGLAKGVYTIKVDVNGEINTQQLIVM